MIEVIPAMDLMDGKCVRLRQGDFDLRTDYSDDPVSVALAFEAAGFRRLHLVDLDGARSGAPRHLAILEKIAAATSLEIDFSGGIKTAVDLEKVFAAGAALAAVGSMAVRNKPLFVSWLAQFGAEKILLGLDVRDERLAISGWTEQTEIGVFDFLSEMTAAGVRQAFCTDIGKDGMMAGPATLLYQKILRQFPALRLIASGGVSSPGDLAELAVAGCSGAIVGKAIYEDFGRLERWVSVEEGRKNVI